MLRAARLMNPVVRAVLGSRWHRLLSGALVVLAVTGRRSGRVFRFPVMYAPEGDDLLVLVAMHERKTWWRNLRGGADVRVRLRGEDELRRAEVLVGDRETLRAPISAYLRRFPKAERSLGDQVVMVRLAPGG